MRQKIRRFHYFRNYSHLTIAMLIRIVIIKLFQQDAACITRQTLKDVNSIAMGVVVELTSRSNSSRRCVRDLSHQANHGYFGQLVAQATRSGLFFVQCFLSTQSLAT